ncbi:MAG: hypothetical protein ACYCXB_00695 [Candidatus Humimicrobiaceae bacterium]
MKIIQEFIEKGLIKKDDTIDSSQVLSVLKKARRSIKSAKLLIEDDRENSYLSFAQIFSIFYKFF